VIASSYQGLAWPKSPCQTCSNHQAPKPYRTISNLNGSSGGFRGGVSRISSSNTWQEIPGIVLAYSWVGLKENRREKNGNPMIHYKDGGGSVNVHQKQVGDSSKQRQNLVDTCPSNVGGMVI